MDRETAIKIAKSKWWIGMDPDIITAFQLFEPLLCMNFSAFHEAIEKSLGRPVYTHEFGSMGIQGLRDEFLGKKQKPSMEEIIKLIPEEKRLIFMEVPR